jgi:subtilisin family serine protease
MGSYIAAESGNDWGTVGAIPWVRVFSVRAMAKDARSFEPGAYRSGVRDCTQAKVGSWPTMAAVSLSLGCGCRLPETEQGRLDDAVVSAHDYGGLSVVAAAGNDGGAVLDSPARTPGILPIAAGSTAGYGLCAYATWSPDSLVGPGCGVDTAGPDGTLLRSDGGGSSAATAVAAAVVAMLKSLKPEATYGELEDAITSAARSVDGRRFIDGEGAARALGLGAVVDRAKSRAPVTSPAQQGATAIPPSAVASPGAAATPPVGSAIQRARTALPRPKVRLRFLQHGRFELRVLNRPSGVAVEVLVARRSYLRRTARLAVKVARWTRLTVRFVSTDDRSVASALRNPRRRLSSKTRGTG